MKPELCDKSYFNEGNNVGAKEARASWTFASVLSRGFVITYREACERQSCGLWSCLVESRIWRGCSGHCYRLSRLLVMRGSSFLMELEHYWMSTDEIAKYAFAYKVAIEDVLEDQKRRAVGADTRDAPMAEYRLFTRLSPR